MLVLHPTMLAWTPWAPRRPPPPYMPMHPTIGQHLLTNELRGREPMSTHTPKNFPASREGGGGVFGHPTPTHPEFPSPPLCPVHVG